MIGKTFWNLRPSATGRQLVMFPFLGGFGSSYNRLVSELDGDWDIWTANPPGHGPCQLAPVTDREELLSLYVDSLGALLRPNAVFFGHSMGGIVAYHLLHLMGARCEFLHRMPTDLVLSACAAPDQLPVVGKAALSDGDLIGHLSSFGAIPVELSNDKSMMAMFVPVFRADYRVLEDMMKPPSVGLPVRTRLILGERDTQTSAGTPTAWQRYFANPLKTHVLEREEHMYVLRSTKAINSILNAL